MAFDQAPTISGFTPINLPLCGQLPPDCENPGLENPSQPIEVSVKGKKRELSQLVTPPKTTKKPRKMPPAMQPKKINPKMSDKPANPSLFPIVRDPSQHLSSKEVKSAAGDLGPDATELKCRQAANAGVQISAKTMNKLASFRYQAEPTKEAQDPYTCPPSAQPHSDGEIGHDFTEVSRSNLTTSPLELGPATVAEEASQASGEPIMDADEEFPLFTSHMDGLLVRSGEDSDSSDDSMDGLLSSILSGAVKPDSDTFLSVAQDRTSNHNHANNITSKTQLEDQKSGYGSTVACTPWNQDPHNAQYRDRDDDACCFRTAPTNQKPVHGEEAEQPLIDVDSHFECHHDYVEVHEDNFEVRSGRIPLPDSTSLKTCGEQMMDDIEDLLADENKEDEVSQIPAIQESFEPPSDLPLPFDDNSQTNEVYDPNLQFSSPSLNTNLNLPQVDAKTFYGGRPTTMDAFRQTNTRLSPAFSFSSPCIAVGEVDNADTYISAEEDLLDDDIDPVVLDIADRASKATPQTILAPLPEAPTTPKLQWRSPVTYKSAQSSFPVPLIHLDSSPAPIRRLTYPTPLVTSTLSPATAPRTWTSPSQQCKPGITPRLAKDLVAFDSIGNALPFARPSFPTKILDRSPILGLSSSPLLRTCFRIGEALNAATVASHTNLDPLIELYARVTYSQRVGVEQFFQFADLFRSERAPFLNGSYVGWKSVDLWDCDSKYFLGESGKGKIARCVGKLKRDEKKRGSWKMVVFSIWEASWDDVGYVKGIVCS